jgi:hypothetical protein
MEEEASSLSLARTGPVKSPLLPVMVEAQATVREEEVSGPSSVEVKLSLCRRVLELLPWRCATTGHGLSSLGRRGKLLGRRITTTADMDRSHRAGRSYWLATP